MVKTLMTDTYFARGESRGGKDRRVLEKMAKMGAVLRRASITHTHTHTQSHIHTGVKGLAFQQKNQAFKSQMAQVQIPAS